MPKLPLTNQQAEFYAENQAFQRWFEQYANKDFDTAASIRNACQNAWQAALDYCAYRQAQKQYGTNT